MRLRIIRAYIYKELVELVRSRFIVMVFLLPTMLLLLFGYGIRMEVTGARTLIIDNDNSVLSQRLIAKFEHSRYFRTQVEPISEAQALRRIKQARADVIVVIPESFEKRVLHHQRTGIGVFVDAAFPSRGVTMETYVRGVILDAASDLGKERSANLIAINQRTLFNQAMRDEDAIVPGLIGLVLLVSPAILGALLIVKEKERGTIFNFYASPLSKWEFITAKLIPAFLLHSLNIFVLFLWAVYVFDVPFRGSFWLYWIASEIYLLISISIGMLISVVTRTQIVAVVLTIIITIIPGFMYSGIIMPISSMSGPSQIEAHIFPVMYYNHILYDVFLIGEGIESEKTARYLGIMIVYSAILLGLGRLFLRKELK
ncbi:ABC transporter permease [Sulfuricurvum sp. IAE1]|jgi:ABC-type multidrug transport system permease subunit|uniref:ABC transporter permease n=1 Tax=Sulfuricurvum sp. IAE1 TaxID=2546102 RepID=UPI001047B66C|nr:ABC transporter permease [Sulfuricurvum sp. IAE1]MDD3770002.1 ABC transporter permease [Sulfuricurvum sp.]MDX9965960.1 ABC transporter permease [Sulfuricurvum sp.]TDA63113.1 ABC transporter permease [Sulfuricurvum sp. IAE1]